MNVLFFLTPKENVAYIYEDYTVRQALEKMKYYHYSAIPIIKSACPQFVYKIAHKHRLNRE